MCYTKKCKNCEKEFDTKYIRKIYCDKVCADANLKAKLKAEKEDKAEWRGKEINCLNCGKETKKKIKDQKHCSPKCFLEYERKNHNKKEIKEIKKCEACGKEMPEQTYKVIKYCSEKCEKLKNNDKVNRDDLKDLITFKVTNMLNKAKNTEPLSCFGVTITEFVSDGFTDKIKREVRNRDDNECQICSDNQCKLEVHHILKRTLGGSNDHDNLVTLCVNCHRAIETNDLEHAIKSCFKKACKLNGKYLNDKLNQTEKINSLRFCLEDIFDKLNNEKGYELNEILIKLDKTLVETS